MSGAPLDLHTGAVAETSFARDDQDFIDAVTSDEE